MRCGRLFSPGLRAGIVAVLAFAAACATGPRRPPAGTPEPDRFLFERGTEELNDRDWFTAREYFRQLVDSYPQSEFRPHAKLGIGDTHLGEGTTEGYVLAINEYKEFLSFYPTHRRADYAQFKLGMAHFYQMRGPMRDQTETQEAIREFATFVQKYQRTCSSDTGAIVATTSCSDLLPEVRTRLREARDRLGQHEMGVGVQYHRSKWYPGAIERLKTLLENDPQFTYRDEAMFYLADSYEKIGRPAEALPYYDRLLKEFEQSEFLERARLRVEALRASLDTSKMPAGTEKKPGEGEQTPAVPASKTAVPDQKPAAKPTDPPKPGDPIKQ
jgi:outer membrane protein assembly factor BamD